MHRYSKEPSISEPETEPWNKGVKNMVIHTDGSKQPPTRPMKYPDYLNPLSDKEVRRLERLSRIAAPEPTQFPPKNRPKKLKEEKIIEEEDWHEFTDNNRRGKAFTAYLLHEYNDKEIVIPKEAKFLDFDDEDRDKKRRKYENKPFTADIFVDTGIEAFEYNNTINIIYFKYNKTLTDRLVTKQDMERNKKMVDPYDVRPEFGVYKIPKEVWEDDENWITMNHYPKYYEMFWNKKYPNKLYPNNPDSNKEQYGDFSDNYPNLIRVRYRNDTGEYYKLLNEVMHSSGYIQVNGLPLPKGIKDKYNGKHRIIAHQFLEHKNRKANIVDHEDNNTWNDRLCNLRWVTHGDNSKNPFNTKRGEAEKIDEDKIREYCITPTKYENEYRGKKYTYEIAEYRYDPLADYFYRIPMENSNKWGIVKWNGTQASLKVENPKEGARGDHTSISRNKFNQQYKEKLLESIDIMRQHGISEQDIKKVKKRCGLS